MPQNDADLVYYVVKNGDDWFKVVRAPHDTYCDNCPVDMTDGNLTEDGPGDWLVQPITPNNAAMEMVYCDDCLKAQKDNADDVDEQWFQLVTDGDLPSV